MASRNDKKKMTFEDKFARHFYCQRARINSIRRDKKQCTKKFRKINKNLCKKSIDIWYFIVYNNNCKEETTNAKVKGGTHNV